MLLPIFIKRKKRDRIPTSEEDLSPFTASRVIIALSVRKNTLFFI